MTRWLPLGLCLSQLACSAESQIDHRPELVGAAAELVLRPLTAELETRAASLREASAQLCAAPEDPARLDAVQLAWWELRGPWRQLRALPLGPIVDEGYDTAIDFWPGRPASVEGGIEAGITSQAELDVLGVASKGMVAIEYLLWDPEGGDALILAQLGDAASGPGRCAYLELLAADLELRLSLFADANEAFAVALEDAGSSLPFPTLSLATDALLNAAITGLHDLSERSLAKPFGLGSEITPSAELLASTFSDRSRADILDALAAFERFYLGADGGRGFTALVRPASPEIDARVRDQLERTLAAAEALPDPLRALIEGELAPAETLWEELRILRQLLAADVAGLLGVSVALSDNDGD